jgi:hypothetical protein
MSRKKKNVVAVIEETPKELVKLSFEEDSGAGLEGADADSYAIPFLTILQKGSPQCDPDHGSYLTGAKPGMIFNNVTEQLVDGEEGLFVVPATFRHCFVEWVPREDGGGFRGLLDPNDPVVKAALRNRDDKGRFLLDNGNHLSDTRYHFVIVVGEDGPEPVVLSLTSTQIKKSRRWMTQMRNLKLEGKNGKYNPPTFSHIYRLTTVPEQNDKGSWRGWKVELIRMLADTPADSELYLAAKAFIEQISSGTAQVIPPEETTKSDF